MLDFDWLGFFESPTYAAYLASAARSAQQEWPRYQALAAEAEALVGRGDTEGALQVFRQAAESLVELTPFMFPPEVAADRRYREETLHLQAWWMLQCKADPSVRDRQQQIEGTLRAIDYRDPLPALRQVAALVRAQASRLGQSDAPPDPDGMAPADRARVWVAVMLGAWVRMLSAEQRLELLRELHGAANVIASGQEQGDEVGMFGVLACPICALRSLQPKASPEWTCLGCFFRQPAPIEAATASVELSCPSCHAPLRVGPGVTEATCASCGKAVHRLVENDRVLRQFSQSVREQAPGAKARALPSEGLPGVAVAPEQRHRVAAAGLGRLADAYAALIDAARLVQLVQSTAEALGCAPRELLHAAKAATPRGHELLQTAEALLPRVR